MNVNNSSAPKGEGEGFTLAETLITLVIVGVVTALITPTLIAKYTEQQTVTAVKKFYSEISQAYNSAVSQNGPPETWEWETSVDGHNRIFDIFAKNLRIMNRCKDSSSNDCFGNSTYKTLNSSVDWWSPNAYDASGRLDNGFIFWIYSYSNCNVNRGNSKQLTNVCGVVGVDINGYKKPNQLGKDVFYFHISKYGVIPMGSKYDVAFSLEEYCKTGDSRSQNGYGCSAWIIEKGNMDYLHRDVSW